MKKQLFVAILLSLGYALPSFAMPGETSQAHAAQTNAAFALGNAVIAQQAVAAGQLPGFAPVSQIIAAGQQVQAYRAPRPAQQANNQSQNNR